MFNEFLENASKKLSASFENNDKFFTKIDLVNESYGKSITDNLEQFSGWYGAFYFNDYSLRVLGYNADGSHIYLLDTGLPNFQVFRRKLARDKKGVYFTHLDHCDNKRKKYYISELQGY